MPDQRIKKIILITTDSIYGMQSAAMVYRYAKDNGIPAVVEYVSPANHDADLLPVIAYLRDPCIICFDNEALDFMTYESGRKMISHLQNTPDFFSVFRYDSLDQLSSHLGVPKPDMTTDDHAHAAVPYVGESHG